MKREVIFKIIKDDVNKGFFMVAIVDDNKIIGIPARELHHKDAKKIIDNLRYSFDYGYRLCETHLRKAINNYCEIKTIEE